MLLITLFLPFFIETHRVVVSSPEEPQIEIGEPYFEDITPTPEITPEPVETPEPGEH